jgi:periplasmic protein TonB
MTLRTFTWLISFALHGAIAGVFLITPGGAALDEGAGEDTFVVEQGIAIEGFAKLGQDEVSVEAVEAPPPVIQSRPVEEKPIEEDVQRVIGSESGPEQEKVDLEPKPEEIPEVKPEQQVTAVEQTEAAVDEKHASGAKQSGGSVTAMSAYRGKLFTHISKRKVNPRSRHAGTVVVRFTVGLQGELISREVATSSGSKLLDEAAVASIERAAPFPAMPSDASSDGPLVVSVPFKFSVR